MHVTSYFCLPKLSKYETSTTPSNYSLPTAAEQLRYLRHAGSGNIFWNLISSIHLFSDVSNERRLVAAAADNIEAEPNVMAYCKRHDVNPKRARTGLSRFNQVNIMAADALAPYFARTSAAMILTI